ncbi:hypothetical protein ACTFIU_006065 [Dictyostelium citrinum]
MKIINKNLENGNDILFFKVWRNVVIRRRISKYLKLSFCELFLELSSIYENGLRWLPTICMFNIPQDRYFWKILDIISNIKILDYNQYTKDRKKKANNGFKRFNQTYEKGICSWFPTIIFFDEKLNFWNNINRNSNIKFLDYTQYTKDRKLSANDSFKQLKQTNNLRNKNSKNDIKNKLSKRTNKKY